MLIDRLAHYGSTREHRRRCAVVDAIFRRRRSLNQGGSSVSSPSGDAGILGQLALSPGTLVGPYEIVDPLGAGGMGEVYRARDSRLKRTVAIKVLAGHVSADLEFRSRFEREARAIAALNHPHICTLYDIGRHDGIDFLVMEHLEGQTLATRLATGTLPFGKHWRLPSTLHGRWMAPTGRASCTGTSNPRTSCSPRAGQSCSISGSPRASPSSRQAPPVHSDGYRRGWAHQSARDRGHPAYMAPEQLEGKDADARTDIYAFGVVVYEMLTGKRPFDGKTPASLIAAILTGRRAAGRTCSRLPPSLNHVVATCLARDPDSDGSRCATSRIR